MNIFIELPTWLGDAIMASAVIESITKSYPDAKITFFGTAVSTAIYTLHPNCKKILIDNSKSSNFRLFALAKIALNLEKFDIAISFRSHFATKFLFKFIKSKQKFIFKKTDIKYHQVEKYLNFILENLKLTQIYNDLKIYSTPHKFEKPTLGLNPGASYGSAKRWYPEYFAEVAINLKDKFDIIIFGGNGEREICSEIAEILTKNGVNFINLCGKTDIKLLCELIGGLDLFITNDSGPMHIAATFKTPTIALFGPTKFDETSPYKNKNAHIVHLNLECMPCMKRVCPLKTHECMKELKPQIVLDKIKQKLLHI